MARRKVVIERFEVKAETGAIYTVSLISEQANYGEGWEETIRSLIDQHGHAVNRLGEDKYEIVAHGVTATRK